MSVSRQQVVVIIGAGTAGITVAASLRRHSGKRSIGITIIDPAEHHYYQPAFTLVGGGCYPLEKTRRTTRSLIPKGVSWLQQSAKGIDADNKLVTLTNGQSVPYDYLVVCPGLVLDWSAVDGLEKTIGKQGVCSNYSQQHAEYTWACIQSFKAGGTALFTQAPLPFKCPGAPQKIAYLAADYWREKGYLDQCELRFLTPTTTLFGVPYFAKALDKVADGYGLHKDFMHQLVKVDGSAKIASFKIIDGEKKGQIKDLQFDMLHVTPHQTTPAFLHGSVVSNDAGYVNVHQHSMQQIEYPTIFSLGDACSTPNSKTAAAVRRQAPVVVQNIYNLMDGLAVEDGYNGYASCPLTTAKGKAIMAEFIYGGKVTPTLPYIAKPNKPSTIMWYVKTLGLPVLYWHFMLKGHEKFLEPRLDYDCDE